MKYQEVIKTAKDLAEAGRGFENNIIERFDIDIIAHFGNLTCFEIMCSNCIPYGTYNNTANIGYIIRTAIELFDLSNEEGVRLSKIHDVPCRLVYEGNRTSHLGERAIGIGHWMKDKFILFDDLTKVDEY